MKHIKKVNASFLLLFILLTLDARGQDFSDFDQIKVYQSENELTGSIRNKLKNIPSLVKQGEYLRFHDATSKTYKNQIHISKFPKGVNVIIPSPDNKYLIAYEEQENATRFIYFLTSKGELLKKQEVNVYPSIKYSHNGEYVELFNQFGREIFLFTNHGELIYKFDYIDLIKNNQVILYNVFASSNGDKLLLNTSKNVHLISKNKDLIWEAESDLIGGCQFYEDKEIIALKSIDKKNKSGKNEHLYVVKIISAKDGHVIDEMKEIKGVTFTSNGIFINKNNKYYEYGIK